MSHLETHLKRIVVAHPWARVHPNSPSGPYVRAVLWTADSGLLGQALWEPDPGHWTVRAYVPERGDHTLTVIHLATDTDIHDAITQVIDQIRKEHTR